jgi:hypothetical protein
MTGRYLCEKKLIKIWITANRYYIGMPGDLKRRGQSKGSQRVTWREFNLESLKKFIENAQSKGAIDDELVDSVARNGQNVIRSRKVTATNQKYFLGDNDEFHKKFLTGNGFRMCLIDLKTPESRDHEAMAQALEDAFTSKARQGATVKDDNGWVVKVYCFTEAEALTPSNILIILLKQILNLFHNRAVAKGKTLDPFKVRRIHSISEEYDEHQKRELDYKNAWETLKGFVKQILNQFPEITLTFIISGINAFFKDLGGLPSFVIMMGRLLHSINSVDNITRTKCLFCGGAFQDSKISWEDGQGRKGTKEFNPVLSLIIDQAMEQSKEAGQEKILKEIIDQLLVLSWSSRGSCFRKIHLNAEITSNALVLVSDNKFR